MDRKYPINSYDEWSKLREIIVGVGLNYKYHHIDLSFKLFYNENTQAAVKNFKYKDDSPSGEADYLKIPQWIIDELNEDIEGLVNAIRMQGVIVHRPTTLFKNVDFNTPGWSSRTTPPLNVRDNCIILGNNIVETATHVRGRYFENDHLKDIFYEYFQRGCNWLCMPKPMLSDNNIDPGYFVNAGLDISHIYPDNNIPGGDAPYEMIFDGAQCMRLGKDILVNVANKNHELGFLWLQRLFGEQYNFHKLDRMADNHIDSILLPLRPGMLLLRSPEYLKFLPEPMKKWTILYPPEPSELRFPDYGDIEFFIASRFIDLNILSLDENTVIVNSLYPELITELERHGFTVIPVQHRHRRLFGGGFHCFTLDTVRQGELESYF